MHKNFGSYFETDSEKFCEIVKNILKSFYENTEKKWGKF